MGKSMETSGMQDSQSQASGGRVMAEEKKKKAANKSTPQIYVGQDKVSIARTVNAQINYLAMPTPLKYIMQRKGRGGLVLDYVETNYVIGRLNATFMFDWDSEIIQQIIDHEHNQIAMKIRLTVRFANEKEVKKDAWGGSDIKWSQDKTKMIDLADDLKSAESDGIKKAASMLGICWDVYAGLISSVEKKEGKKEESDGFTEYRPEDTKNIFRTIPIIVNEKKIMHTKYEVLDRFKAAKSKLGDELYYKTLGENGYEKADQVPEKDIQKLYDAMAAAYKEQKITPIKKTEEELEPEKKAEEEAEEAEIIEEPEKESKGFTTEEVEKESAAEFPVDEKEVKEEKPEMPLQKDIMKLNKLEATLCETYKFKASQIIEKLEEMYGEANLSKLTKKQTDEAIKYFELVIEKLEKEKAK